MISRTIAVTIIAGLAIAFSGSLQAGQLETFGKYEVHYNALTTNQLPLQAASAYNIQRSPSIALLTISVLEKSHDDSSGPVAADVKAEATNLINQHRTIRMREVEDEGAIYYLGTLNVNDQETYNFTVNVQPNGIQQDFVVRFRKQFFTD